MPIQIANITRDETIPGLHQYEVSINGRVIAIFWHNREDGLAMCLQRAAIACATSPATPQGER